MIKNAPLNFYIVPKDKADQELLENNAALVLAAANGNTVVEALAKLKMPMTMPKLIERLQAIETEAFDDIRDWKIYVNNLIKDLQGEKETINA